MKSVDFSRLVFRGAVLMSACDGDIADSELAELEAESSRSSLLDGLDIAEEFQRAKVDIDASVDVAIERFLNDVKRIGLNIQQQTNLVRLLVRIARADGKIEVQERVFLLSLIETLQGPASDDELGAFAGLVGPVFRPTSVDGLPSLSDKASYTLRDHDDDFLTEQ